MLAVDHVNPAVLLFLIVIFTLIIAYIKRVRSGANVFVRKIAGIDAMDEAVGRAAEMGRPVSFTTGLTSINPVLYACLGALHHVVKKVATYKTKLLMPHCYPEVMAIADDVARDAYQQVGRGSYFDTQSSVYLSDEQFAFTAGYMGLIQRENVGSAFLFGEYAAESLILAEAGRQVGAMQVAASTSPEQVAFFICTCDYTLIGEELFATSAYLTREPVQLGSLMAQDRVKLIVLVLIAIGSVIATINVVTGANLPNLDEILKLGWSDAL